MACLFIVPANLAYPAGPGKGSGSKWKLGEMVGVMVRSSETVWQNNGLVVLVKLRGLLPENLTK